MLLLTALLLLTTGCSSIETQFANSPYGLETKSMVDTCMEKQKKGLLSGVNPGESKSIEFSSEGVNFSDRDNVTYPLQLNCIVIKQDKKHSFSFIKESKHSQWELSK